MHPFNRALWIFLFIMFSSHSFGQKTEMDKKYHGRKIIVQNFYYPKSGKLNEVLALRIAASERLKELGLTVGRVFITREIQSVVWQAEYQNLAAFEIELRKLSVKDKSKFDKDFREKMKLLINKFERTSSYVMTE